MGKSTFPTEAVKRKLARAMAGSMKAIAAEAVSISHSRIRNGMDIYNTPFKKRKKNTKRNQGRAILVDSGALNRGTKTENIGPKGFLWVNRVKYASVHNYGGTINRAARSETFVRNRYQRGAKKGLFKRGTTAGQGFTFRAGSFQMPRRQFMGKSPWAMQILYRRARVEILRRTNSK